MSLPASALDISDSDRRVLCMISRSKTSEFRAVQRAKVPLGAGEGLANSAIARRHDVSVVTVRSWRRRFEEEGLTKFAQVAPGRGRKSSIPSTKLVEIVEKTMNSTPENRTHWSTRTMAKEVGFSAATVQRLWSHFGIKSRRVATFKLPNDPQFNVKVIGQCLNRHRHQEFLKFLNRINQEVPDDLQIHLILDNYATHKHKAVKAWITQHPRFYFHFTPTSSSWLNQVERWFREITDKNLKRGIFHNVDALVDSITTYIEIHNQETKPYVWTATAEQILAKIETAKSKLKQRET